MIDKEQKIQESSGWCTGTTSSSPPPSHHWSPLSFLSPCKTLRSYFFFLKKDDMIYFSILVTVTHQTLFTISFIFSKSVFCLFGVSFFWMGWSEFQPCNYFEIILLYYPNLRKSYILQQEFNEAIPGAITLIPWSSIPVSVTPVSI